MGGHSGGEVVQTQMQDVVSLRAQAAVRRTWSRRYKAWREAGWLAMRSHGLFLFLLGRFATGRVVGDWV